MDEAVTLSKPIAEWVANLVANQQITVGHPDSKIQAQLAWETLRQLGYEVQSND